jgi:two-component system response regulator HydG
MVVEDDLGTATYLRRALERAGYAVDVAASAFEAIDLFANRRWDVLLIDIGLPGKSGFELVEEVKERWPLLPIALTTADANMDVALRALRSKVDDFVPKPVDPGALVELVERLVAIGDARRVQTVTTARVLAIGAHPDDVEIGVGGLLLAHAEASDDVAILTLSHGQRGGDREARADESRRAAELIGARLFLEDLEDTRIPESDPTVRLIEDAIAEFDPAIVYTHTVNDLHQDHRNVHRASMVAARRVPNVYCYESPSATVDFQPARFASIEPFLDDKIKVVSVFQSQTGIRAYLDEELLRATSRYWGRFGDARYCEPLEVVRERRAHRTVVAAPVGERG